MGTPNSSQCGSEGKRLCVSSQRRGHATPGRAAQGSTRLGQEAEGVEETVRAFPSLSPISGISPVGAAETKPLGVWQWRHILWELW